MQKFVCGLLLLFVTPMISISQVALAQQSSAAVDLAQSNPSQPNGSEFDEPRRLLQQRKYQDALSGLHQLETKDPAMKGLSHELGLAYYKKADYLNAIASLKKAQEEAPGDNEAVQLLGLSCYFAGRPGAAIPFLEKVQTWFPNVNVDGSYVLGICYIQTKDYPHARGAFAKMFDVSADSAASYLFTARMLLRQGFCPVAE